MYGEVGVNLNALSAAQMKWALPRSKRLLRGKYLPVPTAEGDRWAPLRSRRGGKRKITAPARNRTPVVQPIVNHFTD